MPATVPDAFRQFKANLEITALQESTVSTRQNNVRNAVARDFYVLDSFLTGSYRRSTMIAPLSTADVDVFVVLDPKHHSALNQFELLSALVGALKKEYPTTPKIRPDGQAATITFSDFKVDVVPAFNARGSGFLIPDASARRWIATDPKKHVDLWSSSNNAHNGNLIPLIKMMKCWNRDKRNLMRSFHLEVLVRSVLSGVVITDFSSGARYLFDKMRSRIGLRLSDPAGYDGDIASYLSHAQATKIIGALDASYRNAQVAEEAAYFGDIRRAIGIWGVIFGEYFPALGR